MNSPEAVRRMGITYRQADHWIRCGWLRPDYAMSGSGTQRDWSREEVAVGERMGALVHAGLTASVAARVARGGPVTQLSDRVLVVCV